MSRHLPGSILLLLPALLSLLPMLNAHGSEQLPGWMEQVTIEEGLAEFPDEDIVQLYSHRALKVDSSGKRLITIHSVYHLREGEGKEYRSMRFVESDWRNLVDLRGWRQSTDGETEQYDETVSKQLSDREPYTESVEITLSMVDVEPGDIFGVEYQYEENLQEASADRVPARSRIPLVLGEYDLEIPKNWSATGYWVEQGSGEITRLAPEIPKQGQWSWEWRELPGSDDPEPYEPSDARLIPLFCVRYTDPSGQAASMQDWKSISEWYGPISRSALETPEKLEEVARQLLAGIDGEDEQVARIAEFVRSSVAFVQISLGDGGWRPHPAHEVHRNLLGDCKDMAHLAVALLRPAGISAYPALTHFDGEDAFVPELPIPHFNHCIVAIERPAGSGSFGFFDPTAKSVSFGRLPSSLEGGWALVVGSSADSALVQMPSSEASDNVSFDQVFIELLPDLRAVGWAKETMTGQSAFRSRHSLRDLSPAEQMELWESHLGDRFAGVRIKGWTSEGIDVAADTLHIEYQFEIPAFGRDVGNLILLQPNLLSAHQQEYFAKRERKNAMVFGYPYRIESIIDLQLSSGWAASEVPAEVSMQNRIGGYTRSYTVDGSTVRLTRVAEIRRKEVSVDEYRLAQQWDRTCYTADSDQLVIAKP